MAEKTSPKVSIIVPVYKVEQYLCRCLDSIVAQTFTDWECILIDDGSPDKSGAICDEYAGRDSRFRVIHQENKGVSAARNAGLDAAQGEWIGFVDSDDWVEPTYIEELYQTAIASLDTDISICNIADEFADKSNPVDEKYAENPSANIKALLLQEVRGGPWAFLCKKKLIENNNISFDMQIFFGEDFLFKIDLYACSEKLAHVHKFLYHYNKINESSACARISSKKCFSMLMAVEKAKSILEERKLLEENAEAIFYRCIWTKLFYIKSLPHHKRDYEKIFNEQDCLYILDGQNTFFLRINRLNRFLLKKIAHKQYVFANMLIDFNNFYKRPYSK